MSHLILSHLSANNNKPEIVDALFGHIAGNTEIVVASRKKETALYHIEGKVNEQNQEKARPVLAKRKTQLSLFEDSIAGPL